MDTSLTYAQSFFGPKIRRIRRLKARRYKLAVELLPSHATFTCHTCILLYVYRIRSVRNRLVKVLTGFGARPEEGVSFILSGCYFAATEPKGERQAFARGVVDNLLDEQEKVEWPPEAIEGDLKNARFTTIGCSVTGVLCCVLLGLFVFSQFRRLTSAWPRTNFAKIRSPSNG